MLSQQPGLRRKIVRFCPPSPNYHGRLAGVRSTIAEGRKSGRKKEIYSAPRNIFPKNVGQCRTKGVCRTSSFGTTSKQQQNVKHQHQTSNHSNPWQTSEAHQTSKQAKHHNESKHRNKASTETSQVPVSVLAKGLLGTFLLFEKTTNRQSETKNGKTDAIQGVGSFDSRERRHGGPWEIVHEWIGRD